VAVLWANSTSIGMGHSLGQPAHGPQLNEALKLRRRVYFGLRSFEQYGDSSCVISTSGTESISLDIKTAQIRCGRHIAALNLSRQDTSEYVAVDEQLVK
jgi:hypothetical protein